MKEIFPGIFELLPSKPTPKKYRTFFIKREGGNLLIPCFSTKSTVESHFDTIARLGGLSKQLLGDSHFRSSHCDEVADHFNAPLYCSVIEAPVVTATLKQVLPFPFERHYLDQDIEVLPTPGHRPGGVCYLITIGAKRCLFVGDFIWHDGHQWIPTATKSGIKMYAKSLDLLNSIEFDLLLSNSMVSNPTFFLELDHQRKSALIAALQQQLANS